MNLNLYKISQDEKTRCAYDAAIVCAQTPEAARLIHPSGFVLVGGRWPNPNGSMTAYSMWVSSPDKVRVEWIGRAGDGMQPGVVLASFNA